MAWKCDGCDTVNLEQEKRCSNCGSVKPIKGFNKK